MNLIVLIVSCMQKSPYLETSGYPGRLNREAGSGLVVPSSDVLARLATRALDVPASPPTFNAPMKKSPLV